MDKKIQERENENFEQKHDTLLAEEMIYPQVKEELKVSFNLKYLKYWINI